MDLKIEKDGPLPRYLQIKMSIREDILSGKMAGRIVSERELARRCKVSYLTVRRAIGELVDDGLLFREQGRGTFVSEPGRTARTTHNVGFVFRAEHRYGLADPYFSCVLNGLEQECRSHEHAMFCSASPEDLLPMGDDDTDRRRRRKVDGIIVVHIGWDDRRILEMNRFVPIVSLNGALEGAPIPAVLADNVSAGRQAVAHLVGLGHRRIAHVTGPLDCHDGRQRLEGYRAGLAETGIAFDDALVIPGNFDFDSGGHAADTIVAMDPSPTAVFCASDMMAMALMKRAQEMGMSIPGDLSVVGMDDILAAAQCYPELTTLRVDKEGIGRLAFKMLLQRVDADANGEDELIRIVPVELVERASCRKI